MNFARLIRPLVAVGAAALLVSACAYVRAVTFEKDPKSGTEGAQQVAIHLIGPLPPEGAPPAASAGRNETAKEIGALKAAVGDERFGKLVDACAGLRDDRVKIESLGAVLVGFVVQQGLSMVTDVLAARVDALVASGKKTYSASVITTPDFFAQARCLVITRGPEKPAKPGDPELGFVLVLTKAEMPKGESTVFRPAYLRMNNALAVTAKGETLDLALGIAGKSATAKDGVRKVDVFATASFTIPSVRLPNGKDQDGVVTSFPKGSTSGLVATPPAQASAIELSVAITETGSALPNAVKARAELEALAKAIGPSLTAKAQSLVE